METPSTPKEISSLVESWGTEPIAFVPTMGALHEGHLSLVKQARSLAPRVVVSIFVNPIQFGPNEDFAKYPRTLDNDLNLLRDLNAVSAVFLPTVESFYPDGFQTYVTNREMSQILCGKKRIGHFDGVLTVVLKLFNLVRPRYAIFGKKDYQQWQLITKMCRDLCVPVEVIGAPIFREEDGLAMSSRNRYLDPANRAKAKIIFQGLKAAQEAYSSGVRDGKFLVERFHQEIKKIPEVAIEYCEVLRQGDLKQVTDNKQEEWVMLTACHLAGVRLIDNWEFLR